jgi:hypothetical protein
MIWIDPSEKDARRHVVDRTLRFEMSAHACTEGQLIASNGTDTALAR